MALIKWSLAFWVIPIGLQVLWGQANYISQGTISIDQIEDSFQIDLVYQFTEIVDSLFFDLYPDLRDDVIPGSVTVMGQSVPAKWMDDHWQVRLPAGKEIQLTYHWPATRSKIHLPIWIPNLPEISDNHSFIVHWKGRDAIYWSFPAFGRRSTDSHIELEALPIKLILSPLSDPENASSYLKTVDVSVALILFLILSFLWRKRKQWMIGW